MDNPGTNFTPVNRNFEISPNLCKAPETLRDLVVRYQNKKKIVDKKEHEIEETEGISKFKSFLNSFLVDILLFTAALMTMIIMLVIIYIMCGQPKLIALVANTALQHIKGVESSDVSDMLCMCKTHWYIMGMLIIITLGMLYLVTNKIKKSSCIKGCLFSNTTKIFLFISNTHLYIHIKLCKVAGSIHLFRLRERLNPQNVKLKKNWIWDVLEIDWSNISIMLNKNEIHLPSSVIIPFRERYRARRFLRKQMLLYHVMLKQGKTWFSLAYEPGGISIANDNN